MEDRDERDFDVLPEPYELDDELDDELDELEEPDDRLLLRSDPDDDCE